MVVSVIQQLPSITIVTCCVPHDSEACDAIWSIASRPLVILLKATQLTGQDRSRADLCRVPEVQPTASLIVVGTVEQTRMYYSLVHHEQAVQDTDPGVTVVLILCAPLLLR